MKIGYFSSKFPYSYHIPNYTCGGSILATQSLVNEISKNGHDIKVFTTSKDSKNHFENHGKIEVYRYRTHMKLMSANISIELFREPLKYDVDIVHTSFDIPPGPFAGLRYAKKKGNPLIVTYHGDWDADYGGFIRRTGISINNKLIVDDLLSYADIIISPSKIYLETSQFLSNYEDKIVFIPNGVYPDEFDIKSSKSECRDALNLPVEGKIILFFGYLSPYKSPDILLKAFKKILRSVNHIMLVFAGDGAMMEGLKKLSIDLGVEKSVKFVGFVGKDKRSLYYRAADVLCLPSTRKTESFGIVNLEAMASGIPVVGSNFGGIPDVIKNEENGLLVPPGDIDALADALINLLNNDKKRKKMGSNGKNKVKMYSWEKIAKKTNEVYKNVI